MINNRWARLSQSEKAELLGIYTAHGYNDLAEIISHYNTYAEGGRLYGDGGLKNGVHAVRRSIKELARNILDREARLANRYSSKDYTFEKAYKDARSKGQKTFYWNGNYYNTDYEGEHGKKYREDIESGKAAAFQTAYPGYTNPELRKEKQEELDTYGITNEQTVNKDVKTKLLHKISPRGYDVDNAISELRGEYSRFGNYDSPDDMLSAINRKYGNKFVDYPLSVVNDPYTGELVFDTSKYDDEQKYRSSLKSDKEKKLFDSFVYDISMREKSLFPTETDTFKGDYHANEYNYILGYPTQNTGFYPMISKYRTGEEPYYYTGNDFENSNVFGVDTSKLVSYPFPLDEIAPGNYVSAASPMNYYFFAPDTNTFFQQGKYSDRILGFLNRYYPDRGKSTKELFEREWDDPALKNGVINTERYNIDDIRLGQYTLGIPENHSYLSLYDKFDIDPFGTGNDKPLISVGKPFEYYTRFYPEGQEPDIDKIYEDFNDYSSGGKIHIKPENRGKFTALKKRTGHSASWFKAHGTPAQKKMAVFALNARKWKHADGGPLEITSRYVPDPQMPTIQTTGRPTTQIEMPEAKVQTPIAFDLAPEIYNMVPLMYDIPTVTIPFVEEKENDYFSKEALERRALKQRYAESGFRNNAVSRAGAQGAYQIMPITYKDYLGRGKGKAGDLNDPEYNRKIRDWVMDIIPRDLGEFYSENDAPLVRLAKIYGAYNWGAGNMRKYLRKQRDAGVDIENDTTWVEGLNPETRRYIKYLAFDEDIPDSTYTNSAFEEAAVKRGLLKCGGRIKKNGGELSRFSDISSIF